MPNFSKSDYLSVSLKAFERLKPNAEG